MSDEKIEHHEATYVTDKRPPKPPEEQLCQCCGKEKAIAVASSGLGAFSIAWCRICLMKGVEPYSACVATAACCDGLDNLNEAAKEVITKSVEYHGKTLEEFTTDVADAVAHFNEDQT